MCIHSVADESKDMLSILKSEAPGVVLPANSIQGGGNKTHGLVCLLSRRRRFLFMSLQTKGKSNAMQCNLPK